jgi:hypothetical protein
LNNLKSYIQNTISKNLVLKINNFKTIKPKKARIIFIVKEKAEKKGCSIVSNTGWRHISKRNNQYDVTIYLFYPRSRRLKIMNIL